MLVKGKVFNDSIRALRSEKVLIILDIQNISRDLLDLIYDLLADCSLKVSVVYANKIYNILTVYFLIKTVNEKPVEGKPLSILKTLDFVNEEIFANETYIIDQKYEVIVVTDEENINSEVEIAYKSRLDAINLTMKARKGVAEAAPAGEVFFTCILFNISDNNRLLSIYSTIYKNQGLFSIFRNKSSSNNFSVLKNTLSILLSKMAFQNSVITKNIELSFTQLPDMKISCDIHSLSNTLQSGGSTSHKHKIFDYNDREEKEIVNTKIAIDPKTAEIIHANTIKTCFELYDGSYIEQEKVPGIFERPIILGKNEDVSNNPFMSVQGFVTKNSLSKIAVFGNVGRALELVETNDKYQNSCEFMKVTKQLMLEKDLAMICLGKLTWNGGVRNYAVFPKKQKVFNTSLHQEDAIKLFIIDMPFKDEIRMYPKINVNEAYKISDRERDQYHDLKKMFGQIYSSGSLNLANELSNDSVTKLDEIISSCNIDLRSNRYQIIVRDAILSAANLNETLTEEQERQKEDITLLDPSFRLVEDFTRKILMNHNDDLNVFRDMKEVYTRQMQHVENNKSVFSKANKRSILQIETNQNNSVLDSDLPAKKKLK